MQPALRFRRFVTGAAAVLLHILAGLLLLAAFRPQTYGIGTRVREITITLPATQPNKTEPLGGVPPPTLIAPEAATRSIAPPALQENPSLPVAPRSAEPEGDVRALGRYLYNCSGAYYERLSPREKEHCVDNKWNGENGPALTLSPAKPSPYDAVIAKRNEKAVPIEHPCPVDKPTSNLGMPCFFDNGQPLVQFQH